MKNYITDFIITFKIFTQLQLLSRLSTVLPHGKGIIGWETAFQFAVIFGIVVQWINRRKRNCKE